MVIALALAGVWVTPLVAALFPLEAATAMLGGLPDSWVQRLHIWSRAGAEIAAHPFGGGVEYARAISRPIVPVEINGVALNTMPLHPHNLFLHIWMDLGVVGALAMSALLLYKNIVLLPCMVEVCSKLIKSACLGHVFLRSASETHAPTHGAAHPSVRRSHHCCCNRDPPL